ncbi:hypothetical protein O6H91_20G023900 [Diphasiastrum complanatum]|uniref:Uncharacterized protein n=1 Tax=Diphasiastrum complanatum TaxID=34168 RepID=A0ACC2ANI8_DIPCM|nr:hypothetical protein O6H91_20G023900 [Diphasiastrum complanatum]
MAEFIKQNEVVDSKDVVAHVQSYTLHLGATSHLKVHSEVSDSSSCMKEHPDTANGLKKEKECLHGAGEWKCKCSPKACYRAGEKVDMNTRYPGAQSWFFDLLTPAFLQVLRLHHLISQRSKASSLLMRIRSRYLTTHLGI